jgi:hypothetical protein
VKRDVCNGPGAKEIFLTKQEALDHLRAPSVKRRANVKQGAVHLCSWGGNHYHITSKGRGKKRR